jgi:hypothetical protein
MKGHLKISIVKPGASTLTCFFYQTSICLLLLITIGCNEKKTKNSAPPKYEYSANIDTVAFPKRHIVSVGKAKNRQRQTNVYFFNAIPTSINSNFQIDIPIEYVISLTSYYKSDIDIYFNNQFICRLKDDVTYKPPVGEELFFTFYSDSIQFSTLSEPNLDAYCDNRNKSNEFLFVCLNDSSSLKFKYDFTYPKFRLELGKNGNWTGEFSNISYPGIE